MDNETRAVAKEKANAMNERIGYPELITNPEELNKEYILVMNYDFNFLSWKFYFLELNFIFFLI